MRDQRFQEGANIFENINWESIISNMVVVPEVAMPSKYLGYLNIAKLLYKNNEYDDKRLKYLKLPKFGFVLNGYIV